MLDQIGNRQGQTGRFYRVRSARRQDEITQLRWNDSDPEKLTGIVPRLKGPGGAAFITPADFELR